VYIPMLCRRYLSIIILGSIIGLTFGLLFKNIYHLTAKQSCKWHEKPILINCVGEELKEETILRAIKYWDDKGEEILFYQYYGNDTICNQEESLEGFIILRKDNGIIKEREVLATTKRHYRNMFQLISAEIYFDKGTYNFIYLLEHELGHAFGYNHKKIPGNIMHPYYDMMGTKF